MDLSANGPLNNIHRMYIPPTGMTHNKAKIVKHCLRLREHLFYSKHITFNYNIVDMSLGDIGDVKILIPIKSQLKPINNFLGGWL